MNFKSITLLVSFLISNLCFANVPFENFLTHGSKQSISSKTNASVFERFQLRFSNDNDDDGSVALRVRPHLFDRFGLKKESRRLLSKRAELSSASILNNGLIEKYLIGLDLYFSRRKIKSYKEMMSSLKKIVSKIKNKKDHLVSRFKVEETLDNLELEIINIQSQNTVSSSHIAEVLNLKNNEKVTFQNFIRLKTIQKRLNVLVENSHLPNFKERLDLEEKLTEVSYKLDQPGWFDFVGVEANVASAKSDRTISFQLSMNVPVLESSTKSNESAHAYIDKRRKISQTKLTQNMRYKKLLFETNEKISFYLRKEKKHNKTKINNQSLKLYIDTSLNKLKSTRKMLDLEETIIRDYIQIIGLCGLENTKNYKNLLSNKVL